MHTQNLIPVHLQFLYTYTYIAIFRYYKI